MKKSSNRFNHACLILISMVFLTTACNINIDLGNLQPTIAAATATNEVKISSKGLSISMRLNGVAQDYTIESVDAVAESADVPSWGVMPAHTVLALTGYPIQNHLMTPQLFIYPAAELAKFNEGASVKADNLKTLLLDHKEGKSLPFLPLFNAAQVMHAQVKFLDFKNGKGVRFLTQFDQAPLPINNHELFYTFQGLTNDGKYYIAAILPVNLASLSADEKVNEKDMDAYMNNFMANLNATVASLNQQTASAFSPDLVKLDGMIQSIEIK
jgi:hypothetical protein